MIKYGRNEYRLDIKKSLMNKSLSYLSKFSSTENKLNSILHSFSEKYLKNVNRQQLSKEIAVVIQKCKDHGYIDDKKFTENKIDKYINLGKSKKYIIFNLKNYGINNSIIEECLDDFFNSKIDNNIKAAIIFARKKSIGPFYKKPIGSSHEKLFNKWFSSFARAGFNYDISKKVLNFESSFDAENFLCNIDNKI